jgi:hypothetical protein
LKKAKNRPKKSKTRLQVSHHSSNLPQQKLAPKSEHNHDTMYAAGFCAERATLLRLPTDATKLAMILGAFAHVICENVTMYGLNMKINKYECL